MKNDFNRFMKKWFLIGNRFKKMPTTHFAKKPATGSFLAGLLSWIIILTMFVYSITVLSSTFEFKKFVTS